VKRRATRRWATCSGSPADTRRRSPRCAVSLELQPDDDETHRLLGRVLAAGGDWDGAIAETETAIRIRPDYWRGYMQLGTVSYSAGRLPAALEAYRRASEMQTQRPCAVVRPRSDLPAARRSARGHRQLRTRRTSGRKRHGVLESRACVLLGRAIPEAVEAWQKALAINPNLMLYHRQHRRRLPPAAQAGRRGDGLQERRGARRAAAQGQSARRRHDCARGRVRGQTREAGGGSEATSPRRSRWRRAAGSCSRGARRCMRSSAIPPQH
jgi:tetratricopeptide (TPR) repeat protein